MPLIDRIRQTQSLRTIVITALCGALYWGAPLSSAQANLSFGSTEKKIWDKDWKGNGKSVNISWKVNGEISIDNRKKNNVFSTPYIYIPNSKSNSLVQLDTRTGNKRWSISLDRVATKGSPSRTTVDINGHVWVGLRGSTKVAHISKEGRILKIVNVGKIPRAITIDFNGDVWVGAYGADRVVQIDGNTGKIKKSLEVLCPYGATTDTFGNVWVVSRCISDHLTKISPEGQILGQFPAHQAYGIASDANGHIWTTNIAEGCVHRFDNKGRYLGCIKLKNNCINGRGVAVDGKQNIWVACSNEPLVIKLSNDGRVLAALRLTDEQLVGLAVDANGFLWAVSRASSTATKIDTNSNRVVGSYTTHGLDPYTYSDMTGFQLQAVAKSAVGVWRANYSAPCTAYWRSIRWDSKVPQGTRLEVRARSAATEEALARATWTKPLKSGSRPGVTDNPWIQIEARLITHNVLLSPVISKLVLEYMPSGKETCNGLDDDCDGKIDNLRGTTKPMSESCRVQCRKGTRECIAGQWKRCTASGPIPENCSPTLPADAGTDTPRPDIPFTGAFGPGSVKPTKSGCSCESSPPTSIIGLFLLLLLLCRRPMTQDQR